MTDLLLAFGTGVTVGLALAWIVIPGVIDVWIAGMRRTTQFRRRGR